MSKQIIVVDYDKDSSLKYKKMLFIEFLEMIARVAV